MWHWYGPVLRARCPLLPRDLMGACSRSSWQWPNRTGPTPLSFPCTVRVELERSNHSVSPASGARVLVVDDEPAILRVVQTNLTGHDFRVETADTGRAALEAHSRFHP